MSFTIADLFEHAVDLVPGRIALETRGDSRTYAELEARSNALAHRLQSAGVGPGDAVGLYSRNTLECVEAMLAIFKVRAVMVNVNFRYVEAELEHMFTDSGMKALIFERRYSERVRRVLPKAPSIRHLIALADGSDVDAEAESAAGIFDAEAAIAQNSSVRDFGERSNDDIYMLYTGGTTGRPKGVVWRQEDVFRVLGGGRDWNTGEPIDDEWKLAKDGASSGQLVRFPVPPFIHGGSQWAVFQALFGGGKAVVYPEFGGHHTWEVIERHKVNVVFITGDAMGRPMIDALLEKDYDTSSLFSLASSAALFSATVKDQFLDKLPDLYLVDAIGSTETGFSGMGRATKGTSHTGGPRVSIDSASVVMREDGTAIGPGSDEVGQLARSGHIPLRYHNDPVKTAKTFRYINGVRYSIPGDFARVEADGSVTMLGRGSASINSGGEKIYPEEVEAALKAHPDIFDVLVIGVPDERFGQGVGAVAVTRDGARPTVVELNAVARTSIAGYKCPRSVWFVDEIKRSPAGKPDYPWALGVTESRPADDAAAIPPPGPEGRR